ncbi:MAG: ABC transporter ATP-binding protein [Clostridia bacterium]|nr:ABC transporter ATP-binding protein [Clostridia bacterium]
MKQQKKKSSYLSGREIRAIAKQNKKIMMALEAKKHRRAKEEEFLCEMKDENNILEIDDLHTYFFTDQGVVKAVNGVSFNIPKNKTVGIVGESGCGKSVTSMSIMRLLQGPTGQIYSGAIRFAAEDKTYDIAQMPISEIHRIRGKEIAMIFQEPMTSLNPIFTIGDQLDEVTYIHNPEATAEQAQARSLEMLKLVGIAAPERVYNSYPHELSGGMRQRVMISMALVCNPRLIIADEPTTALDVTIQAQILDLLRDLKDKINGSIMLITHDLGVIAEMADFVVVMYAGKVIEMGTVQEIFKNPMHPYTIGLQKSKPTMQSNSDTLFNIPGNVPNPVNMPTHCYFKERCDRCCDKCGGDYPDIIQVSPTHFVSCHLYNKEGNANG